MRSKMFLKPLAAFRRGGNRRKLKRSQDPECFDAWEIGSAEALASARYVHRLTGEMTIANAAVRAHVAMQNATGIWWLMGHWRNPSDERIAATCFVDPTVTPADVAEWFGQPLHWAVQVYTNQKKLRRRWPAPLDRERQACGLFRNDPSPEEIRSQCRAYIAADPDVHKRVLTARRVQHMMLTAMNSTVAG